MEWGEEGGGGRSKTMKGYCGFSESVFWYTSGDSNIFRIRVYLCLAFSFFFDHFCLSFLSAFLTFATFYCHLKGFPCGSLLAT